MKMKEILKTGSLFLGIVIVMVILIPAILNYILQCSLNIPIIGEGKDWLAFWGSYISGAMTVLVIYQTYRIQKDMKRQQLNSLLRSEQIRKVDSLKKIMMEYWTLTNPMQIIILIRKIMNFKLEIDYSNMQECLVEITNMLSRLSYARTVYASTVYYIDESPKRTEYEKALNDVITSFKFLLYKTELTLDVIRCFQWDDSSERVKSIFEKIKKFVVDFNDQSEWDKMCSSMEEKYNESEIPCVSLFNELIKDVYCMNASKERELLLEKTREFLAEETSKIYNMIS